jgi:hypothetical protein
MLRCQLHLLAVRHVTSLDLIQRLAADTLLSGELPDKSDPNKRLYYPCAAFQRRSSTDTREGLSLGTTSGS